MHELVRPRAQYYVLEFISSRCAVICTLMMNAIRGPNSTQVRFLHPNDERYQGA